MSAPTELRNSVDKTLEVTSAQLTAVLGLFAEPASY